MMDIGKYFSSSNKRDLSDNSQEAAHPKQAKATSSSSYSKHDVFEEGLDTSNSGSIIFDWLKNLEFKVNEIFANTNTFKEKEIKGENQLTDLAETVHFLSQKFHEFEANRKLKEELKFYVVRYQLFMVIKKKMEA